MEGLLLYNQQANRKTGHDGYANVIVETQLLYLLPASERVIQKVVGALKKNAVIQKVIQKSGYILFGLT